jgi:hypothetical protein
VIIETRTHYRYTIRRICVEHLRTRMQHKVYLRFGVILTRIEIRSRTSLFIGTAK